MASRPLSRDVLGEATNGQKMEGSVIQVVHYMASRKDFVLSLAATNNLSNPVTGGILPKFRRGTQEAEGAGLLNL